MTIKKLMMGAGAVASGPQVTAPSSNDWDYTFASNKYPVAGNTLGDHSIGAYWKATGSNNGISSLITLDGDFEIEFTLAETNNSEFGVHAIDEDDTRTTDSRVGMSSMTNSFWYRDESVTDFMIGGSTQSDTHTFADGSVVKIERVSGTIKVYDDGVVVHTYGTTYSGAMRFGAGDPGPQEADYDNFKITDTEKIQRDGFFNEGTIAISEWGDLFGANYARRITATRTGTVGTVVLNITLITTSFDAVCQIYSDDGTSPASIIGSASDTVNIGATGDKTFTFASLPEVVKGTTYWVVFSDTTLAGTGRVTPGGLTQSGLPENQRGCGRHGTITSITDNEVAPTLKMEMRINATGEPTPDHDTLLLISSDTSDSSQTFVDSSQFGRTVSVNGNAQHDTAQKKFGASSVLMDGTSDYLTVADDDVFDYSGPFTIDFWVRSTTASSSQSLYLKRAAETADNIRISMNSDGTWGLLISSNGSSWGIVVDQAISSYSADTWYHVALAWDGATYGMWIDGTSVKTASNTSAPNTNTASVHFGARQDAGEALNGWMDEIRISRVARWEPGTSFTPPTSPYP